ncbi:mesaconyl-C4 CoA hydratase [Knoellia locipacati]|uniref:mesaconyl-C4 CoA hydratase n=1 Tax=Knoellia locipacati TaxID=882824 RepID=UPI00384A7B86
MTIQTRTEVIANEPAESLAALLDIEQPGMGVLVPPLWHWTYLLDRRRQAELGPDGHPSSGFPAPAAPGMRRMFAGGRVETHALLRIGAPATRAVLVASTTEKRGRSGPLTFVTVRHEITQDDQLCIVEEQDIVYRAPGAGSLPVTDQSVSAPVPVGLHLTLDVDETLLFRFSAVTWNAHRIHYDREWARHEGYDDLVVHGPLQALMMGEFLRRSGTDLVGREFAFRLVAPMVGPQPLVLALDQSGQGAEARDLTGRVTATSTTRPLP